nr:MAG TPA: hypothetical protein [Bacteriophage sp.]
MQTLDTLPICISLYQYVKYHIHLVNISSTA